MIDHIDIAVTDLERSRALYLPALAPLGINPFIEIKRDDGREGTGFGSLAGPQFWIGKGPSIMGRLHIAFAAESRSVVDAFYRAALQAGGTCKGAPGLRPRYGEHYCAAFVLDPDGHTIEAVCRKHG